MKEKFLVLIILFLIIAAQIYPEVNAWWDNWPRFGYTDKDTVENTNASIEGANADSWFGPAFVDSEWVWAMQKIADKPEGFFLGTYREGMGQNNEFVI